MVMRLAHLAVAFTGSIGTALYLAHHREKLGQVSTPPAQPEQDFLARRIEECDGRLGC